MQHEKYPTVRNGKVCYIEIPATDVARAADFYQKVFGWKSRRRGDGQLAFDDTVGEVSGSWVKGRKPSTGVGVLVYIMVDSVEKTTEIITREGGIIVQPVGADAPEITARFTDPDGNVFGLYQEPG